MEKFFSLHLLTFSFYHLCGTLQRFIFSISDLWPLAFALELQMAKVGTNFGQKAKIFVFDLMAFSAYHQIDQRSKFILPLELSRSIHIQRCYQRNKPLRFLLRCPYIYRPVIDFNLQKFLRVFKFSAFGMILTTSHKLMPIIEPIQDG